MKTIEICNCCKNSYPTRSGSALSHIKTHGFSTMEDYYYSFHDIDLCEICGIRNKFIRTWDFLKGETCDDKNCKLQLKKIKLSKHQKKLASENRHNYQSEENKAKSIRMSREKILDGTHKSLTAESRAKKRKATIERNLKHGNPMKNPEVAARMAKTSRGKILSTQHKQNISLGMQKFLGGLSIEDFTKRMKNTENIVSSIEERQYKDIEVSHIFENYEFYIDRTNRIIDSLVLNENDLGIA